MVGHVEIGLGITERQRLLALDTQVPAETCDGNALVEAGGIDVKRAAILDAFELERRRLGQMCQVAVAGPDQTAAGLVQDGLDLIVGHIAAHADGDQRARIFSHTPVCSITWCGVRPQAGS